MLQFFNLSILSFPIDYKNYSGSLTALLSKEERKKILHGCHIDPTAGHMGRQRTISRIKKDLCGMA